MKSGSRTNEPAALRIKRTTGGTAAKTKSPVRPRVRSPSRKAPPHRTRAKTPAKTRMRFFINQFTLVQIKKLINKNMIRSNDLHIERAVAKQKKDQLYEICNSKKHIPLIEVTTCNDGIMHIKSGTMFYLLIKSVSYKEIDDLGIGNCIIQLKQYVQV